jgi:16S rRNA G966 N2-methylase RsmD
VETNALYYGDNLSILRNMIRDESVDLVYLDPPLALRSFIDAVREMRAADEGGVSS